MALLHVILGLVQHIGNILQRGALAEILDRKDTPENRLKPEIPSGLRRNLLLEKSTVGVFLDINQVGNINDILNFCEVLA